LNGNQYRQIMKIYSTGELAEGDGKSGNRTLVAVGGKVYDLSGSKKWITGLHMRRHSAGADLSTAIKASPHGPEIMQRFPIVGVYQEARKESVPGIKGKVDAWLEKYPFFRRHPHPAVVHVPIGIVLAVPLFEVLALVTGSVRTEWAAYCCLVLVLVSIPMAIASGYLTWWFNYDLADQIIINWKRRLAWIALVLAAAAAYLRTYLADPLDLGDPFVVVYVIALVWLAGLISTIGFLGGKLTFPCE
jgi:predicted heme/steroid binding protein/uncharacterized membrane protein